MHTGTFYTRMLPFLFLFLFFSQQMRNECILIIWDFIDRCVYDILIDYRSLCPYQCSFVRNTFTHTHKHTHLHAHRKLQVYFVKEGRKHVSHAEAASLPASLVSRISQRGVRITQLIVHTQVEVLTDMEKLILYMLHFFFTFTIKE